ncbi:hypothetical protein ES703_87666 [subsurface metagenome]
MGKALSLQKTVASLYYTRGVTMRAMDKVMISARLPPQIVKRLDKHCQQRKLTRQAVIEKALERYLG